MSGDDPEPTPPEGMPVFGYLAWSRVVDEISKEITDLPARVACLPGWRLAGGEGAIERTFDFSSEAEALRFLNFSAGLARRSGWLLDLEFKAKGIGVRVRASRGQRLSESELAAATELHASALRLGAVRGREEAKETESSFRSDSSLSPKSDSN